MNLINQYKIWSYQRKLNYWLKPVENKVQVISKTWIFTKDYILSIRIRKKLKWGIRIR